MAKEEMLCIKKQIPEDIFYQEFNNTKYTHNTLLFFGLGQSSKALWDVWGYTFNRRREHAEIRLLGFIKGFLANPQQSTSGPYKLIAYLSYSPCETCCPQLLEFVTTVKVCQLEIRFSKLYPPEGWSIWKNMSRLHQAGIQVKVMKKEDFEECYHLFVIESDMFKGWPKLDKMAEHSNAILQAIVHKGVDECDSESTNNDVARSEQSPRLSQQSYNVDQPRTPEKPGAAPSGTACTRGVRRKLNMD